jgi:hypothetical protein
MVEVRKLTLRCSGCGTELEETEIFKFLGGIACEKCVRNYYRDSPFTDVNSELQTGRKKAVAWLKRHRLAMQRRAARGEQ